MTIYFVQKIRALKWWLHDLIWPKQKWITKGIGRVWQDKPELLVDIMYNFITHLVEDEKFLENTESEGKWGEARQFVGDCYNWIKFERPILIEKFDNDYSLMNKLNDKDTCFMIDIVKWRGYFWT